MYVDNTKYRNIITLCMRVYMCVHTCVCVCVHIGELADILHVAVLLKNGTEKVA